MKVMSLKILAAAVVCLCLASAASAQVPNILNYQGRVSVGGTNLTTNAEMLKNIPG